MSAPRIGFLLGSKSDLPQLERGRTLLAELDVPHEVRILSAHRTPSEVQTYCETARERGLEVLVGMAGMAAALPGAMAAHTDLPVLGIPAAGGSLFGVDALLSIVQMPPGVAVATFGIGKAGAMNAALFACQILGTSDQTVRTRIQDYRERMRQKVLGDDAHVQRETQQEDS